MCGTSTRSWSGGRLNVGAISNNPSVRRSWEGSVAPGTGHRRLADVGRRRCNGRALSPAKDLALTAKVVDHGLDTVVGSTGTMIWPHVAMFPTVHLEVIDADHGNFIALWNPILDAFDREECRSPRVSARSPYEYWSIPRVPWRPSTTVPRSASTLTRATCGSAFEPVGFIIDLPDRIYHVDCNDTQVRP